MKDEFSNEAERVAFERFNQTRVGLKEFNRFQTKTNVFKRFNQTRVGLKAFHPPLGFLIKIKDLIRLE